VPRGLTPGKAGDPQLAMGGNECFPSGHHTGRSVPARSDQTLIISNKDNACELAVRLLLVGKDTKKHALFQFIFRVGLLGLLWTPLIFGGVVANRIRNFFAGVILYFLVSVMRRNESWRDWLVLKFSTRRRSLPYTSQVSRSSAHALTELSWVIAVQTPQRRRCEPILKLTIRQSNLMA